MQNLYPTKIQENVNFDENCFNNAISFAFKMSSSKLNKYTLETVIAD